MQPGTSEIIEDAADDIAARGFCYFKLVPPPEPRKIMRKGSDSASKARILVCRGIFTTDICNSGC